MSHTPLGSLIQKAARTASESVTRNVEVEQILEESLTRNSSRRDFLKKAVFAGAATAFVPKMLAGKTVAASRIAIIGGGLAGLTCAYRLRQAGITSTIYEANTRVGGRCWTLRGAFDNNQIAEHGGELIDTGHKEIITLIQELAINTDNLKTAEVQGTTQTFYTDGSNYPYASFVNDLKAIYNQLQSDYKAAGWIPMYVNPTARQKQLDSMSIIDWLNLYVPNGGANSRLGKVLNIAYNGEFGEECDVQSALNMITMLGKNSIGNFSMFGVSNEKLHIRGGNDMIVQILSSYLATQIVVGSALAAVSKNADGTYALTMKSGLATTVVTADHVVFALPFSILRSSVDLTNSGFSTLKKTAIAQQGMGSNTKLHTQFTSRVWSKLGSNGETYSDNGYMNTWDVTRAQPGTQGILANFTGGNAARAFGSGTLATQASTFLSNLNAVLPGTTAAYNGRATLDYWPGNPYSLGSYAYWKKGQYLTFAGYEGVAEGNAHFAGEHTSINFQGYLNGAVETGVRSAREIYYALIGTQPKW